MSKKRILTFAGIALVPVLIGLALAGLDVWRQSTYYVSTRDAQVTAPLVGAQAAVAGRVGQYMVEVGDVVQQGDVLASLTSAPVAAAAGGVAAQPAGPSRLMVNVRAPVAGTVLSKAAPAGAGVTAGQTLVTIGDLDNVWVVANVEEGRVAKVRPGQPVEVKIDALEQPLTGTVVEVTPATASTVAPPVGQARTGTGSAATRTIQTVPVRVALDRSRAGSIALYPGMSAEVKIDVR